MPSSSKKQSRYMSANCKSPKFRKKTGMKKSVACDFHSADKGKFHESFSEGNLPKNIERFIEELVPTDTGVAQFDNYIIAYEGFSDECIEATYERIESGEKSDIEDIFEEVQSEWNTRFVEHGEPIYTGHHYTEDNPIMVAVYNRNSKKTIFDSLMDEDIIRDRKVKLAKDLIDKIPSLADILLDPKISLRGLLNRPNPRPEGDGNIFELPEQIDENFRPSTFLRVGRNLVELQMGWANKEKNKARSNVFVNGKSIGHYSFEGKQYRVDEDNLFESVEEAIAHLIKTNAPYALPHSNPSDYLKTLINYRL